MSIGVAVALPIGTIGGSVASQLVGSDLFGWLWGLGAWLLVLSPILRWAQGQITRPLLREVGDDLRRFERVADGILDRDAHPLGHQDAATASVWAPAVIELDQLRAAQAVLLCAGLSAVFAGEAIRGDGGISVVAGGAAVLLLVLVIVGVSSATVRRRRAQRRAVTGFGS
ncbi:hypothetical protein [Schumannella sp. 10F1B-5-1]|uniref:hypothetical protein n=1 Tax=Schumannella sp. 10F1B-5-1 TaxID=2590780 RepID=UPI0011305F51|nr:hypothetical protein [Schumannella sp. 10F1B-5-1]TPW71634.1 hypothetical protein FJ658_09785 [Schumannella sp. 10F1B-5-1]